VNIVNVVLPGRVEASWGAGSAPATALRSIDGRCVGFRVGLQLDKIFPSCQSTA